MGLVKNLNRVLISDAVDPNCVKLLQQHGIAVDYKPKMPLADLLKEIANYDGLIVRSATKVTKQVIDAATNLRIIGRAGTGVDNIDADAATKRGIIVMNTPGGNTLSAAEHTCAMMMAASRLIPQGYASMQTGKWERSQFMGHEVFGKTLAILGLGRIGREVATRMQAFGMRTIGYDPLVPAEACKEFGVEGMSLEEIWPLADFITVHVPLMKETQNLIGDAVLRKCKKGVTIVNVARGGVVDEAALLRSIEAGHCGGAALDVFAQEPPSDLKLVKHPKVVATPHLGANTEEAQSRVAEEIAQQFIDYSQGKPPVGVVNAPLLSESLVPGRSSWIALAQSLGQLGHSLVKGEETQCEITVTVYNKGLEKSCSLLASAAAIGALRNKEPSVNLVNVKHFADQHSIKSTGVYEQQRAQLSQSLSVRVQTSGSRSHTCVGRVSADDILLLSVDGLAFGAPVVLQGSADVFQVNAAQNNSMIAALEYFNSKDLQVESLNQTEKTGNLSYLAASFAKRLEKPEQTYGNTNALKYIVTV